MTDNAIAVIDAVQIGETNAAAVELDERERRIEAAERDAYLVRGQELRAIRDGKLYQRRYNLSTFIEYCDQRWELTEVHAGRLIGAASFADKVLTHGLGAPSNERHIRPLLTRLESDDDRIAVWGDVLATTNGAKIKAADVDDAISRFIALRDKEYVTLAEWRELDERARETLLSRIGKKSKLNKQDNNDIEWADWSWNPVTGCLHGCPYCYARDIAFNIYPEEVGFAPALWPGRLTAPANQKPAKDDGDPARKNIFSCSMADLFGRWVPSEWIERTLATAAANPQWNFLFLTKFPKRMSEFEIPSNAWMGTTVDLQARVVNAEKAFEKVKASVRWLSIEPMLEPLEFKRLDLFDWIVIGGASSSEATDGSPATPAWNVPIDWLVDLHRQARAANCKVYYKDNSGLHGATRIREYPGKEVTAPSKPHVFDYLRAIPKADQTG
jgi:protein gp37